MGARRQSARTGRKSRTVAADRFLELRSTVLARMQASVPADLQAELGAATSHQLEALGRLPDGGLTMHQLASSLAISGAAACALADRLVTQGLAERLTSPDDRRVVRLAPTAKGRGLAQRHQEAQRRAVVDLMKRLDDRQVAAWLDIMETLAGADEGDSPAGAPRELVGVDR